MKLVDQADLDGHAAATRRGAVEGILASVAVTVPGSYLLHRRWGYYRSLPLTIKALGVVLLVAPAFAIQAERRGVQYDMEHNWTGAGKIELEREANHEESRWNQLTTTQKVGDWALRHRWHLFVGCWGASMVGSWLVLRRNTTQSFSQKIVQARVYAQGITLATLLGGAALTQFQQAEHLKEKTGDHSWARLLEEQAREAKEKGSQLPA